MAGPEMLQGLGARKEPKGEAGLRRTLGTLSIVALGIGAIIGAGLFSLTGIAAAENAGPAVTLSFMLAALGCAFAGLCYSELAGMIPSAGSAYAYAYAALGELAAWIIGWDLLLEYAVGAGAVAVSWSTYVQSLLHGWGVDLPHWLAASPAEGGVANLPAAGDHRGAVAAADPRRRRVGAGEQHHRRGEGGRRAGGDRHRRVLRRHRQLASVHPAQ